jgi:hypothetical protein
MTLALALGVLAAGAPVLAAGPATVGLGTATSYAILAGTPSISSTGASTVHGNIGIHPAGAVTGFPPGSVSGTTHKADAAALKAKSDLTIAYDDASGRPTSATHTTLGGLTLVAGVYTAGGATLDLTGTLTLNAEHNPDAVWIFQATSDLVTASASKVNIINGGQACNVFWQVTSSATLGTGSKFVGTIMALTDIHLTTGATLSGRALARNGAVTLQANTISLPRCTQVTTAPTGGQVSTVPVGGVQTGDGSTSDTGNNVQVLWVGALLFITMGVASVVTRRRRRVNT